MAAEKIRDIIGPELVILHNLKDSKLMERKDAHHILTDLRNPEDWKVWDQLDDLNSGSKIVALYGLGITDGGVVLRCAQRCMTTSTGAGSSSATGPTEGYLPA